MLITTNQGTICHSVQSATQHVQLRSLNTLNSSAFSVIYAKTHLPMILDPLHKASKRIYIRAITHTFGRYLSCI